MNKFWKKKHEELTQHASAPVKEEKKPIGPELTSDDKEKLKIMIAQAEKEKYERMGKNK
jgi:hypothetical protein